MKIEKVSKSNFEKILLLISDYQRFYQVTPNAERNRNFFGQFVEDQSCGVQFLAVDPSANALGFITLYFHFSSLSAARSCVLNDLFVVTAGRKRGVGEALVNYAIQYAREHGFAKLEGMTEMSNLTAQKLYARYPTTRSEWTAYSLKL